MASISAVVIASDGDMVLKVGTELDHKLLVSSAILSRCSVYFKALTSGNFSEARADRSPQNPQTISLKDDDARAMEDMCLLLHGQEPEGFKLGINGISSTAQAKDIADRLLDLAIVVDNYGCVDHLRLQSAGLLYDVVEGSRVHQDLLSQYLAQLVAASYLLNARRAFHTATERLAKETTIPTNPGWPSTVPRDILPGTVQDAILARRNQASVLFADEARYTLFSACEWSCDECREAIDEKWREELGDRSVGLVDSVLRTIELTIAVVLEVVDVIAARHDTKLSKNLQSVKDVLQRMDAACGGICLRCVRAGNSLRGNCVRADH